MRTGLVFFLLMAYMGLLQTGNGRYLLINSELKVALFHAFLRYSTFNQENFLLTFGMCCMIPTGKLCFSFSVIALACLGFHKQGKKKKICFFPVMDKVGMQRNSENFDFISTV